jgi:hypothetical protein
MTQYGGDVLVDRARCNFSNYGSRIDSQGWGWLVATTGYGDLQGAPPPPDSNKNQWYTDEFSGTSSASPIVVGALACVQGALKARGRIPLNPARCRQLRATGSRSKTGRGAASRRQQGKRPTRQRIPAALQTGQWVGVQLVGNVPATRREDGSFRWPAYWHVVWTVVPTTEVRRTADSWSVSVGALRTRTSRTDLDQPNGDEVGSKLAMPARLVTGTLTR